VVVDTRTLTARRDGKNVYSRVDDGCVAPLLDPALCLMEEEGMTTTNAASDLTSERSEGGVQAVADAFDYSAEEPASIPAEADTGVSCGSPTATVHLKSGELIVDPGKAIGLDVFLAAKQVGPTGKAIDIDTTPGLVERANRGRTGRTSRTSSPTSPPSPS